MWFTLIVAVLMGVHASPRAAQALPDATGRVRGTVVKAESGAPLPRATVRLTVARGQALETTSDTAGRFEFNGLSPGAYVLSVTKGSYIRVVRELTVGGANDALVLRMTRGGALTGRIVDEAGEPVVEASVQAWRAEYVTGGRRLRGERRAATNDLGEFRLYGLSTGTYYVVAATNTRCVEVYARWPEHDNRTGRGGFRPDVLSRQPRGR